MDVDVILARSLEAPSSAELFVKRAYVLLFGREATGPEIRFWLVRLQGGLSPADFLSAVAIDPFCDSAGVREETVRLRAARAATRVWPHRLLRRMDGIWRDIAGRSATSAELDSALDYFLTHRRGLADLPFRIAMTEYGAWKGHVPPWRLGLKVAAAALRSANLRGWEMAFVSPALAQTARETIRER